MCVNTAIPNSEKNVLFIANISHGEIINENANRKRMMTLNDILWYMIGIKITNKRKNLLFEASHLCLIRPPHIRQLIEEVCRSCAPVLCGNKFTKLETNFN